MTTLRRSLWIPVCGALAGLCLAGCATAAKPPAAQNREAIYRRVETIFDQAMLLKPVDPADSGSPAVKLTPLLICELASTNAADLQRVGLREVMFFENDVLVSGKAHQQISFVWKQRGGRRQGIRITLNSGGLPAIWEVLDGGAPEAVVFVSQNLEAAAIREFGGALPGRRFAVERGVAETPDVVVARVNDDAPVAMGPIVHLDAQGEITSVNCRCMSTQARQLVATANYELKQSSAVTKGNHGILGTNRSFAEKLRLPQSL